jgi:hypothetical protein
LLLETGGEKKVLPVLFIGLTGETPIIDLTSEESDDEMIGGNCRVGTFVAQAKDCKIAEPRFEVQRQAQTEDHTDATVMGGNTGTRDPSAVQTGQEAVVRMGAIVTDEETVSTSTITLSSFNCTAAPQSPESASIATFTTAFKTFADRERKVIENTGSTIAKINNQIKLNELKKFADSFELHTPVPLDVVQIMSKDPTTQRETRELDKRNAKEFEIYTSEAGKRITALLDATSQLENLEHQESCEMMVATVAAEEKIPMLQGEQFPQGQPHSTTQ